MVTAGAAKIIPGQIYLDSCFYRNDQGHCKRKYLLVLTLTPGDDIVYRLLTSRQNGRPQYPPCFHGDPYPGYYLDTVGGKLPVSTWVDLRGLPDHEGMDFKSKIGNGRITLTTAVSQKVLCSALDCAANAPDTTNYQARLMRDERAKLGCL